MLMNEFMFQTLVNERFYVQKWTKLTPQSWGVWGGQKSRFWGSKTPISGVKNCDSGGVPPPPPPPPLPTPVCNGKWTGGPPSKLGGNTPFSDMIFLFFREKHEKSRFFYPSLWFIFHCKPSAVHKTRFYHFSARSARCIVFLGEITTFHKTQFFGGV